MITPISTIKRWFTNFKKPTQEQFWAWIDSYWHKSEKIPMDTIDGLENAIRGTASADQLHNHLTDSQAHQELFATKVDKEAGKGLSSNDYTNEEKRTNQANAKKRVVNLTVTGDVDKIITLTFADGTALQAPFTDKDTLPENLADIKLNSLNFNHETGVLTGLRSDGQQLTVSLDGRYALIGHTHPEYAYRTHTHSEYAPKEHRHNWDDIDGKPAFNYLPLTGGNDSNDKVVLAGGGVKHKDEFFTDRGSDFDLHISSINTFKKLPNGIHYVRVPEEGGCLAVFRTTSSASSIYLLAPTYQNHRLMYNWTVDNNRYGSIFKELAYFEDVHRVGIERYNWTATKDQQNNVIFVTTPGFIELDQIEHLGSMSFRKVFAGGQVTFTCSGKTIIYTGDNAFNGGDGSTAVVSIWNNKCYIDIRNV